MRRLLIALRTILCVVVVLGVLELSARVDDVLTYGAPFWGPYNDQALYKSDSLGKWGRPGGRYQHWQLNSLGYRGPELKPETVRIVCFGASETFGMYEAPDMEYPRQLERDLNKLAGGDIFQVVNAAYPGETLATAIRRVPQVISQVHPSYAVIYPALANYISLTSKSDDAAPSDAPLTLADRIARLRIVNRVRDLLKSALPQSVQTELRRRQIEHDSANIPVMDRLPQENVEHFRQELTTLIGVLRDNQVQPVLVTHATVFGQPLSARDHDTLTGWRKFYPMLKEEGFLDMERRMNKVMQETAESQNVTIIDAENKIPHRPEYFDDFVHFTTAGAEVMAENLAAGLKPLLLQSPSDVSIEPANSSQAPKDTEVDRRPIEQSH